MRELTYTITDPMGFHARPVGFLAKLVTNESAKVTIVFNGKEADARRLYQVLGLNIKTNDTMTIRIEGEEEHAIENRILALFKEQQL